jgi:hypothetical protein
MSYALPIRCSALLLAAAVAAPLSGQRAFGEQFPFQPRIGAGYVTNVPNQFVGVSAHVLTGTAGGLGVYVDVKFDLDSPEDEIGYLPNLTAAEVEDQLGHRLIRREGSWTSVNVALMRPLAPQFVLYAGVGYSDGREYRQYVDEEGQMGQLGHYWVRDVEGSGARLNALGGAMVQFSPALALQLGLESRPGGFTIGASYLIPLR